MSRADAPVGIFDSGLGGLSVAREVHALLPAEDLLYVADTEYCPYGGRPLEQIRERSLMIAGELVERGAKAIVVACNTASGAAIEALRAEFPVPFIGLEPAVKPAAETTRVGRIGVMATEATLRTERFSRLLRNHAQGVEVYPQGCPGLVELVEAGETSGALAIEALTELLAPLRKAEVDTVVLGCTHYPFLRAAIAEVMGPGVRIIDSGMAVARQVERVLREQNVLRNGGLGTIRLFSTADPERIAMVAERLLDQKLPAESL